MSTALCTNSPKPELRSRRKGRRPLILTTKVSQHISKLGDSSSGQYRSSIAARPNAIPPCLDSRRGEVLADGSDGSKLCPTCGVIDQHNRETPKTYRRLCGWALQSHRRPRCSPAGALCRAASRHVVGSEYRDRYTCASTAFHQLRQSCNAIEHLDRHANARRSVDELVDTIPSRVFEGTPRTPPASAVQPFVSQSRRDSARRQYVPPAQPWLGGSTC